MNNYKYGYKQFKGKKMEYLSLGNNARIRKVPLSIYTTP